MITRCSAKRSANYAIAVLLLLSGRFLEGSAQQTGAQQAPACDGLTSTAAMLSCEQTRYQHLAVELRGVYMQLQAKLSPVSRNALASSQTAWLKFRDSNAALEASLEQGGTLAPLLSTTAKADLTQQRIEHLRKLSDSQGIGNNGRF